MRLDVGQVADTLATKGAAGEGRSLEWDHAKLSLHPSNSFLAVASKNRLAVFPLHPKAPPSLQSDPEPATADISGCSTSAPSSPDSTAPTDTRAKPPLGGSASWGVDGGDQPPAWGQDDWGDWGDPPTENSPSPRLVAVASGPKPPGVSVSPCEEITHVVWMATLSQLHNLEGRMLLRQRLHTKAVRHIRLRTWHMGENCIKYQTEAASRAASGAEAAKSHNPSRGWGSFLGGKIAVEATSGSSAPALDPISYQKWSLPRGVGPRADALCVGTKPRGLYSILRGVDASAGKKKMAIVTGGSRPCLASLEVDNLIGGGGGSKSTLAALAGGVVGITSGVYSLAKAARSGVSSGPAALTQGIFKFVANPLLLGIPPKSQSDAEAWDCPLATFDDPTTSGDEGHWPLATFDDPSTSGPSRPESSSQGRSFRDDARVVNELAPPAQSSSQGRSFRDDARVVSPSRPESSSQGRSFRDDARVVNELVAAPRGTLLSMEGASDQPGGRLMALVLYAPKRQMLELWPPRSGPMLGALQMLELWPPRSGPMLGTIQVGGTCRLLQRQLPFGTWTYAALHNMGSPPTPAGTKLAGNGPPPKASSNRGGEGAYTFSSSSSTTYCECCIMDPSTGRMQNVVDSILVQGLGVARS
eukprot:gene21786-28805_t